MGSIHSQCIHTSAPAYTHNRGLVRSQTGLHEPFTQPVILALRRMRSRQHHAKALQIEPDVKLKPSPAKPNSVEFVDSSESELKGP